MNRRRAVAIAGAVTATTAGSALAIAANVGLLGFARSEPSVLSALRADDPVELVVDEQPTSVSQPLPEWPPVAAGLPPEVVVQYEDIYVQDPAVVPPPAPAAPAMTSAPLAPEPAAPAVAEGEAYEDDEYDEYFDDDEDDEDEDEDEDDDDDDDEDHEDEDHDEEHDGDEDDD